MVLSGSPKGFPAPVGVTATGNNGSVGDREGGEVGDGVEIRGAAAVADPEPFPPGALEAGVIALTLGTESIDPLKAETISVNGETVVVGNGLVLGAAAVLLAVVPVLVVTGTLPSFGSAEGAAVFLTNPVPVIGFAVHEHWETGLADKPAGGQLVRIFGIALVERDDCIAMIDFFDRVVDMLGVVALVGDEGTLLQRDDFVGLFEHSFNHGGIRNLGSGGQLIERQAGDAVHEDMVLVTPVEFVVFLVVLV